MEEAVYKELQDLCKSLLNNPGNLEPRALLKQVRNLEEKLILIDYLNHRGEYLSNARQTPPSEIDHEIRKTLSMAEEQAAHETTIEELGSGSKPPVQEVIESPLEVTSDDTQAKEQDTVIAIERPTGSINQTLGATSIQLGLNDKLAFTKYLFDGSQEDLNRVISQLNTFTNYQEASNFLQEMIKPDYDWSEKEEYENRLVDLVRARFGEA